MSSSRIKWQLALLGAGIGSGLAGIAYLTQRLLSDALPTLDGSKRVKGLRQPVEIIRDRWAVPHIYAQTEEDLFFAQGYVQAQDRLFQMDLNRRAGYGRLSELAGSAGVKSDRLARYCGWPRAAEAQWAGIQRDPETRVVSEAFAAGVNSFIAETKLPAEYRLLVCAPEPWHPRDGAAWGAVLAWGLSVNWQMELLRTRLIEELGPAKAADLTPLQGKDYAAIFPEAIFDDRLSGALLQAYDEAVQNLPLGKLPAGSGLGSNNWVVNGKWTESGRPMLANDPHLPPLFPTLWYENHLSGGRYNVSGFTTPGVPGIIIGHNEHIAWGVTNAFPDIQDLFVERFHPDDPDLYEAPDGWKRAEVREEVIQIRGQRRPLVERVRYTRHGPVISDLLPTDSRALALRWTSHDENNHLRAVLGICRAAKWDDLRQAAADWAFPAQNVVFADTSGNIGYLMPGKIPLRGKGEGLVPAPGWRSEYDWQGWIDHQEMPALFNPAQGYIVTANNRVAGDDYPHLLSGEWQPPYRAARIAELIQERAPLNVARHAQIQNDTVSLPAQRFVQLALFDMRRAPTATPSDAAKRALERLRDWDGDMRADAVAPTLAYGWMVCFTRAIIFQAVGDELGHELLEAHGLDELPTHPFHGIAIELALRWLGEGAPAWAGATKPALSDALETAINILRAQFGSREEGWQWGRLHYVNLYHHLAHLPVVGRLWRPVKHALGGDGFSVNQARVAPQFPPAAVHVIASCRMILDVGAWDNSASSLPGGQSAHPASVHYQDSIEDWLQGEYHPMLYNRERIETEAENRLFLHPDAGEAASH